MKMKNFITFLCSSLVILFSVLGDYFQFFIIAQLVAKTTIKLKIFFVYFLVFCINFDPFFQNIDFFYLNTIIHIRIFLNKLETLIYVFFFFVKRNIKKPQRVFPSKI